MIIEVADVMLVKAERTKESLPAASLLRKAGLAAGRDSFVLSALATMTSATSMVIVEQTFGAGEPDEVGR